MKSIPLPQSQKHQVFAKKQESARKDVERAFGVLQSRFAIVRGPSRMWFKEIIGEVLQACVIMHNMIVEDECDSYIRQFDFMILITVFLCLNFLEIILLSMKIIFEVMQEYVTGLATINCKWIWLKRFGPDFKEKKTMINVMFYFYLYVIFLIQ